MCTVHGRQMVELKELALIGVAGFSETSCAQVQLYIYIYTAQVLHLNHAVYIYCTLQSIRSE